MLHRTTMIRHSSCSACGNSIPLDKPHLCRNMLLAEAEEALLDYLDSRPADMGMYLWVWRLVHAVEKLYKGPAQIRYQAQAAVAKAVWCYLHPEDGA